MTVSNLRYERKSPGVKFPGVEGNGGCLPEEKVLSGKPVASHFMGVASSDLELPESYYTSEASFHRPHPVKGIAIRPEHALERIQATTNKQRSGTCPGK